MPLDLGALTRQARAAATAGVAREGHLRDQIEAALAQLHAQAPDALAATVAARPNPPWLAGVPLGPLDARFAPPARPSDYTVVSTDGSHLDQDHHAALPCWLVNVGQATIRYGASPAAHLETHTQLGYRPEDVWFVHEDRRMRVQGQLLNVRRQVAEVAALAGLCERNPGSVAMVDGTLILSSISRSVQPEPTSFLREYLGHLDRIRRAGCLLASYISRPGATDAVTALRYGCCPIAACDRACRLGASDGRACARLADVGDRLLFDAVRLEPGERTGAWRSTWPLSEEHYGEHAVHFFYYQAEDEIARIEVPAWIATNEASLARLQAVLVAQSDRGDAGYPRVLIEAHHKAVITAGDRRAFESILDDALAAQGYRSLGSAKSRSKRLRAV